MAGRLVRSPHVLDRAASLLNQQFGRVHLAPTTGPQTGTSIARECAREGADLVISLGGDGTVNEIINGLVGTGVRFAALPGGTANVLNMELGVGSRLWRAIRTMNDLVPHPVPLGVLKRAGGESRYFLLMAGIGIDAVIVNQVNDKLKRRVGKAAYWLGGFSLLGSSLNEFELRIGGASYRASFALASRVRNYGGDLTIARGANLLLPEFEVVLFEGRSSFRYLKYFAGVLSGTAHAMSGVHFVRGDRLEVRSPDWECPVQLDGESAGLLPATIEISPESIPMLLPREFVARNSVLVPEMTAGPVPLQ